MAVNSDVDVMSKFSNLFSMNIAKSKMFHISDCMFQLKFCSKQMERLSKKAEKDQKVLIALLLLRLLLITKLYNKTMKEVRDRQKSQYDKIKDNDRSKLVKREEVIFR